ncbi:MAG: alpha/beta fold hydrolase [Bacteroidota bacterium]
MRFSEDRIEKLTCSDGLQREIHIWEPDQSRAIFLAIHGVMDHAGNYVMPALFFKKHNIATVAHEQHGHYRQKKVDIPRFEVFLDDVELMIEWVKEHYPELPIFIMGHSMGGLVVTHFGIRRLLDDPLIKGAIISSPYYVNSVKAPWIVKKLVGVLSLLIPKITVPLEDFKQYVSHDEAIYERHRQNERDHIMASTISARAANELLKAQQWIPGNIAKWNHPLLAIVAGDDRIADANAARQLLGKINPDLITELYYPENYHENFNELNRDEIFDEIIRWVEPHIA